VGVKSIYFFFFSCSGFFPCGASVATGAGVGLAAVTGALVLVVLGLDIVKRLRRYSGRRWRHRGGGGKREGKR